MSQAKVDRYKEEKKNRKKIMAKEKRMRIAGYIVGCLVAVGIIGWAGYSGYSAYEAGKPMETIYANGGLHMKGKRVLSLALAALMTLSLLVVPAAAVSFTDMTNHWAKDDVEYLATQGVVKGTSATTFAPDQKMTACEALLFCSRAAGVDAIDKEAIAEDWEDELKEILPEEMYAWAAQEMAVCLETGIISETELRALSSAGGLVKSITRETLAMYLVRAMQLAPLAQSLTS